MINEDIKEWMQKSLSAYCLNKCNTICCDYEFIVGSESIKFMREAGMKLKPVATPAYGYFLFYQKPEGRCPFYDSNARRCSEHENPLRPRACREFPISLYENEKIVLLFETCELAGMEVKESPLNELLEICKKHGFQFAVEEKYIMKTDGSSTAYQKVRERIGVIM